jgi:alkylhydroperoxidase family enzyme
MINCCGTCAYPHRRDREKAGQGGERVRAVASRRDVPFCTKAERIALALTEAFTRLSDRADQPSYPDSRTRRQARRTI